MIHHFGPDAMLKPLPILRVHEMHGQRLVESIPES